MASGFATWKKNTQNLKHRESLFNSIRAHMLKASLRSAVDTWKKLCGDMTLMTMSDTIVMEERACEASSLALENTKKERKAFADKSSRKLAVL